MTSEIELSNALISLRIQPELGGKITSLFDRRTQREWLWTHPGLPRRVPVYGESYVENLDTGGWDEIFPSISPCRLENGVEIPDHGDLVFLPAEVSERSETSVSLTIATRSFAARFSRRIELEGARLRVDYSLESLSDDPIPYLWAPHPLIALEHGMSLGLPTAKLSNREGLKLTEKADGTCNIALDDPARGESPPHALKFFTERDTADWLTLVAADGSSLRLDWRLADAPYCGFWLNQRAWSGTGGAPYFNLGIEPTTAPYDGLPEAIEAGEEVLLAPRQTRRWSISATLEAPA